MLGCLSLVRDKCCQILFSYGKWRLGRYVRNARQDGVGIRLAKVYDSATNVCAKALQ